MKYIGYFKNINDKSYKLIIDNGDEVETEIILGTDPFIVKWEGEETIYKPLKLSTASINIVHNNYLFDIYSPTAQGTKIILLDNLGNTEWTGYLTPNLYSQSYKSDYETFELEAVDALSTLEYYKYEPVNINAGIVTLQEILINCIKKTGAYKVIYISDSSALDSTTSDTNMYDDIFMSEYNFLSDKIEDSMSYKDVLIEICKFFGLTCLAKGDSVFFLDYDAIKNGYNTYTQFSGTDFSVISTATLSQSKSIVTTDYRETGATLSLGDVYNKISIVNNKYNIENLIPAMFVNENLTNTISSNLPFYAFIKSFDADIWVFRTYWDKNWTNIYYTKDGNWGAFNPSLITYDMLQSCIGASFIKVANYERNNGMEGGLSFNNYICLHRHMEANPSSSENIAMPVLTLKKDNIKPMILASNCSLVINCSAMWTDVAGRMCPIIDGRKDDNFDLANLYVKAKLKVGNKYWNGSHWDTNDVTFKIYFESDNTSHFIGKWMDIKNTVNWSTGIDAVGCGIPITAADNLSGAAEFTLYSPLCVKSDYRTDAVWLKDLDIKLVSPEIWDNTDTVYTNVVNNSFVNELSDISTKITTYDGKDISYSLLGKSNGSYITYFTSFYNKSFAQNLPSEELRAELWLCYRFVNQYSAPYKILELTIQNDVSPYCLITESNLGSIFIIDTMKVDYFYDKNTVKLVEKR